MALKISLLVVFFALMLAIGFYNAGDFYTLKGMVDAILTDAGLSRIRW